jgi:hypothetical protein
VHGGAIASLRGPYDDSARLELRSETVIRGRLLVRVAFHFHPTRVAYLREVLEQAHRLPFENITVAVDTNTTRTAELLRRIRCGAADEIAVHDQLSDPYRLTWAHRQKMADRVDDFDFFMYSEDDMLVPSDSIPLWHERLPALAAEGYLPGFLRVERNRNGRLVSTDFTRPATKDEVVSIAGKPYLNTPFPYQALWLYDKQTMQDFIASEVFEHGHPPFNEEGWTRESAAIGFGFRADGEEYVNKTVLPLLDNLTIDPRCFVFHMPSNYALLVPPHIGGLGTMFVEDLIDVR